MAHPQFQLGSVVTVDKFYGRKKEIRRLVSRICSGQSSAITGDPRTGKTSLLHYLFDDGEIDQLYGEQANKLLFQYLDAETFSVALDLPGFWKQVFFPIEKWLIRTDNAKDLEEVYQQCQANRFGTMNIEKLLKHMQQSGLHLVLLLDEFDAVLDHPHLNHAEFYGNLRSLASRYGTVLTLIIASRQSIGALNDLTHKYYKSGSPYFNFLDEITLSNLTDREVGKFLTETCIDFDQIERKYILSLTGGHPYMMQVAAASLWEAHKGGRQGKQVLDFVGQELLIKVSPVLTDTWRLWTPDVRKTFAIVALDAIPRFLGKHEFDISALRLSLSDSMTELRFLEQRGYIYKDNNCWRVNGKILMIWLAEILTKSLCKKDDLGRFLLEQSWDGLFKTGEKEQFFNASVKIGKWLAGGMIVLVKAVSEGLIDGAMPG